MVQSEWTGRSLKKIQSNCVKSVRIQSSWSVSSRIQTEYGEIQSIPPNSVQMRENIDQNNFEYGHFSRSVFWHCSLNMEEIYLWEGKIFRNVIGCSQP